MTLVLMGGPSTAAGIARENDRMAADGDCGRDQAIFFRGSAETL